ncbi:MAG: nucleotide exchange factor GrpE [Armatimonadetes bacterium]|nr:nucleotide exchange factor GrpE [Armatimonadota bacterium]MDW8122369.1 nucleotide exchange factor GrpE [Armatimonadota bacterium]
MTDEERTEEKGSVEPEAEANQAPVLHGAGEVPAPEASEPSPDEVIAVLKQELEKAQQTAAEMEDRWKRVLADFQNYRKRVFQERADAYQEGKKEAVLQLLSVLDALERAADSLKEATSLDAYRDGLDLIIRLFRDSLKRLDVEPIPAEGVPFDAFLHEAVDRVEREDLDEGTIVEQLGKGYRMGGKVIRPALVRVATKPPAALVSGTPEEGGSEAPEPSPTEKEMPFSENSE